MATVLQHSKIVVYWVGISSNLGILHESQNGPFTPSLKVKISYSWGVALNLSWNTKRVWNWPSPTIGRWLKPLCWQIIIFCISKMVMILPGNLYISVHQVRWQASQDHCWHSKSHSGDEGWKENAGWKLLCCYSVPSSKICGYFPLVPTDASQTLQFLPFSVNPYFFGIRMIWDMKTCLMDLIADMIWDMIWVSSDGNLKKK